MVTLKTAQLQKIISFFFLATHSLKANKVRTYLSMLGIIIGISCIIVAFAVGAGGKNAILKQLDEFGSNRIYLSYDLSYNISSNKTKRYNLTMQDLLYIKNHCPAIDVIAPVIGMAAITRYKNNHRVVRVFGTDASYASFKEGKMLFGRYFTDEEVQKHQKTVILGQTFYEKIFGDDNPIGKKIMVNNMKFVVIGVTQREDLFSNAMTSDYYDYMIIPMSIISESDVSSKIDAIIMKADSDDLIDQAKREIKDALYTMKGREAQDHYKLEDLKQTREVISKLFTLVLLTVGVVASISLIVGGIGIMNVMFITVSERTREIGIQKAIGAQSIDIMMQFICEAGIMSFVGGLVGIFYGVFSSYIISRSVNIPYSITFQLLGCAFLFSTIVGVFFGFYPAYKAAKKNPVDALRYE